MNTLTKYTVTLLLVFTFVLPVAGFAQTKEPPPPPPQPKLLFLACAVLAVGAVIVWGLLKICKKLPSLPPPNNGGGTNSPPTPPPSRPPVTNPPPHHRWSVEPLNIPGLELQDVQRYDIAQYHFADPVMGGEYSSKSKWAVQASTNLNSGWQTTLSVSVFDNDATGGQFWAVYQDGENIYNAYYLPGAQFNLPVDFALPDQSQQFFRLAGLVWMEPDEAY